MSTFPPEQKDTVVQTLGWVLKDLREQIAEIAANDATPFETVLGLQLYRERLAQIALRVQDYG